MEIRENQYVMLCNVLLLKTTTFCYIGLLITL